MCLLSELKVIFDESDKKAKLENFMTGHDGIIIDWIKACPNPAFGDVLNYNSG